MTIYLPSNSTEAGVPVVSTAEGEVATSLTLSVDKQVVDVGETFSLFGVLTAGDGTILEGAKLSIYAMSGDQQIDRVFAFVDAAGNFAQDRVLTDATAGVITHFIAEFEGLTV